MKKIKAFKALLSVILSTAALVSCTKSNVTPKAPAPALQATVSTFAGNTVKGNKDGKGTAAAFYNPTSIAVDAQGNLFVADFDNNLIRKITPAGIVSTFAGNGAFGSANGVGTAASFNLPYGITIDASGNLYVADSGSRLIRRITPDGAVSTLAGSGADGTADGAGAAASFKVPLSIAIDAGGNLYVTDNGNVRKITQAGVVSTLPGAGTAFGAPAGIAVDATGNLYIADTNNNLIRKITAAGLVSTIAGNGLKGSDDGGSTSASFNAPLSITADAAGNLFVGDSDNRIRLISTSGMVTTIAGDGTSGSDDGSGLKARFVGLSGMAVSGNSLYVADTGNNSIRKVAF